MPGAASDGSRRCQADRPSATLPLDNLTGRSYGLVMPSATHLALSSIALLMPTPQQAQEAANNAAAILALDEDDEHLPADVVAHVVAHRIESFADWRTVDPQIARREVGQRVAAWLRGRR